MHLAFFIEDDQDSLVHEDVRTAYTNAPYLTIVVGSTHCLLDTVVHVGGENIIEFTDFIDIIGIEPEAFTPLFETKKTLFSKLFKQQQRSQPLIRKRVAFDKKHYTLMARILGKSIHVHERVPIDNCTLYRFTVNP